MIRTLTGKIKALEENRLVVEVAGIGYLVACPTLVNNFSLEQEVTLQTYLAVRETALDLYGFPNKLELEMFELLLGVPKIGPKSALTIMTQASPTLLGESAHNNDPSHLHKLSGIGKKTCENIIQHLHKKLDLIPSPSTTDKTSTNQVQTDAIDALVSLGYDNLTARETILDIYNEDEEATVNSLVTQALKQIK